MLAKINGVGLNGVTGFPVSVEVDEANGIPRYVVVGNVSSNVREAMERAVIALKNIGLPVPPKRLTVNLAPADIRKDGTYFDLPIVAGMLRAMQLVPSFPLEGYAVFGEVGLNGTVRHVRGTLSLVTALKDLGYQGAIVPADDVQEALVPGGMDIIGVSSIRELKELLSSQEVFASFPRESAIEGGEIETYPVDFSEIRGQVYGVRAALICAAGGHNLLLSGVAGSGKTMIAKRIPSIMPPLSREENIEISKIYSICGLLPKGQALYNRRPFRTPHHTLTTAALTGGYGANGVTPGELALASKGVLFMDELPLFSKSAIEALRQPLEDKQVVINRLRGSYTYAADCLLVGALNPCACGYYSGGEKNEKCRCTPAQIRAYQRGISRPILERIDLCVTVAPLSYGEASDTRPSTSSAELRKRVIGARTLQKERFAGEKQIQVNAQMGIEEIQKHCALGETEQRFMKKIFVAKSLSMRTYHKVLKVARTIADLDGEIRISVPQLAEAVGYRDLEERLGI